MTTEQERKEAVELATTLVNYVPRAEIWRALRLGLLVDSMRRQIASLEEALRDTGTRR